MKQEINLSVIIPVYNTEKYLKQCVESITHNDLTMEIIIVDDGSTDSSGLIVDELSLADNRIKVIHQANKGPSVARNSGMDAASGAYLFFLDSDDWIKNHALDHLYALASQHRADVVNGNAIYVYPNGQTETTRGQIADETINTPLTGRQCFVELTKSSVYAPMIYCNLYRREYIQNMHFRFDETIQICEDELWTPVVISSAQTAVISNYDFYCYRQLRFDSITGSFSAITRSMALFYVTDRLMKYAEGFSFGNNDNDFKSWLYVLIFKLYSYAFNYFIKNKDSSHAIPPHHLGCWEKINKQMSEQPRRRIESYYKLSAARILEYNEWFQTEKAMQYATEDRKIVLIFNHKRGEALAIPSEKIPAGYVITTDRRYFEQATAVVFYLPEIFYHIKGDLDKREGQIWVAWNMESEKDYPWMRDPEIADLFDLWMSYRSDADVSYPAYRHEYAELFSQKMPAIEKQNKCCIIADLKNEGGQMLYIAALEKHTVIERCYRVSKKVQTPPDIAIENLPDICRDYKFVIIFEDAFETDYVAGKFYETLLAGSVPVYLGAPNINDYAPGNNCFVDVRQFDSPLSLAQYINACYKNEQLYARFFDWKNRPLRSSFLRKIETQKEHPFIRLCRKIEEKLNLLKQLTNEP